MANPRINGIVNKVARNGKSFTLDGHLDDGGEEIWFSAFDESQIGSIGRGAEVEFTIKINEKGGRTYHNIQKNVLVHNPGSGDSSASPTANATTKSRAPKPGAIPIDRERCIVRQNSVGVAAQVMKNMVFSESATADDMADCLLHLAGRIEAHTSGDADAEAALKEVFSESSDDSLDTKLEY